MTQTPTTQIRKLLPRHYQTLDLTAAGHDVSTIAKATGQSTTSVRLCQQSPLFQHELSKLRARAQEPQLAQLDKEAHTAKALSILERASEKAASTLENLLDDDDPGMRLRSASAVLDRVFNKSGDSNKTVINITADNVNLLQQALRESNNGRISAAHPTQPEYPPASEPELCQASGSDGGTADSSAPQDPVGRG